MNSDICTYHGWVWLAAWIKVGMHLRHLFNCIKHKHMLIYMMFMWSYVIVLVVWFWTAKLYSKQLNLFISCVDDVHWLLSLHFGKSLVGCPFLEASYKDLVSARIFTWCMPQICWLCPPIMSPLTYQICRWYCITRWSTQLSGCYSGTQ